ncbi:Hypothetical predicted protein [Mytilus galloprovincialis]|uniref:Uncharacterized protein n=1 Tax=Mytilus galloprovincialis TaxID=29158 RepID=A0A8B6BQ69_MYTGA|nr:Hypothetical predicted protein [Mytilus galloprovincialis]
MEYSFRPQWRPWNIQSGYSPACGRCVKGAIRVENSDITQEKNTNLEQQKCIEALKIQLKNQQIIESERDQFKKELENLRQQKEESASRINVQEYVNQIQELKDQVIEKDKTVKMVQDLYYMRSTEFTDEIETLKNEKSDLNSKLHVMKMLLNS